MHPRRSPPGWWRDTNAPRRCLASGVSGMRGSGGRPPASAASIAPRANASSARPSGPSMVFLAAADRVGSIELLVDDHTRQLMREGQRPEAPAPLGALQHALG